MENKHEKEIDGHITINLRIPCKFKVMAENVEYEDEHSEPYYEEEWEYDPEEIINQVELAKEIRDNYPLYVEEIIIDEF